MIKKSFFKLTTVITAMSLLLTTGILTSTSKEVYASEMKSSKEIVNDMGVGWNLGNTFDSLNTNLSINASPESFETAWGNPVTSKSLIDKIKNSGFKTIRIPVSWGQHMEGAPNYTINSSWLNRIKEVVDYAINDGLYVIINVHHDSDWCIPTYAKEAEVTPKLQSLWTQVATKFKNYDDHLIFETLNEPRLVNTQYEWNGGTSESRDVVNKYNAAALKAIRATGGNNSSRSVMIPTYAASGMDTTINDMVVPNDKNIIVSLHAYSPYFFAMDINGTNTWGSNSDKASLDSELDKYYNKFVANGTPVVIGEFGSINKNNLDSRVKLAKYFVSAAKKRTMPCIWWDNNYADANKSETFGLLNRSSLTWYFEDIQKALISGYNGETSKPTNDTNDDKVVNEQNGLVLTTSLNSWTSAYQLTFNIKNNSSNNINGWTLKIKKDNLSFTTAWDVDFKIDGDYYIVTPKPWKTSIAAGGTLSFDIQGKGAGTTNISYTF